MEMSRLQFIRNEDTRRQLHDDKAILHTINAKGLLRYGYVEQMPGVRWLKKLADLVTPKRRKRVDPWADDIFEELGKEPFNMVVGATEASGEQDARAVETS